LGGADALENLVTACKDCNVGKRDRLDVAIRGLIQKPTRQPDNGDFDRITVAHFDMPPMDLHEQLSKVYAADSIWVSDGVGRRAFLSALGTPDDQQLVDNDGFHGGDASIKRQEKWFKEILRQIPLDERWVVERKTGLWTGRVYSLEFADIGSELGESAMHARELYDRGILRLRRLLGLEKP
jgi:hypothetical protein